MRKISVCLALALTAAILSADPALAQGNVGKGLLDSFVNITDGWWGILRGYALFLFTTALTIEICLFGIRMALQQSNIAEITGQFITLLLFAGFIAAVIMNYQEWATGIAIKGLHPLTGELTGHTVDAGKPVAMAALIIEGMLPVMADASVWDFGYVYLYVSCMLILVIIFVLISALVILTTCEFYIIANVGVLLIGLGGSKIFKDYAVNAMRYVLSVAVKLFVLHLIVNIGFTLLTMGEIRGASGDTIKTIKFVPMFYIIGKSVILLALAKVLPDTCAGIVNGSAISGGNPLASMARTAGTMALGAATAGAGYAAGAASTLNNAHTVATVGGGAAGFKKDVMGTLGGMAKAMWQARGDAKSAGQQRALDSNPGSMRNQLISAAGMAKAKRGLDKGGSEEQAAPDTSNSGHTPAAHQQLSFDFMNGSISQSSGSEGSGQAGPQTSSPGGAGTDPNQRSFDFMNNPAPQATDAGGSSQAAPQTTNAGGSGQAAPQATGSGASGQVAPQTTGSGASSQAAPQATAAGRPGPVDFTGAKQSGPVDMRTYKPKN